MINSKRKGNQGEREFINALKDQLGDTFIDKGIELCRNLEQTRSQGADLVTIPGWSIEIKRAKNASVSVLKEWWRQAVIQASVPMHVPALAYRLDYKDWRVMIPISEIYPALKDQPYILEMTADIPLDCFCAVLREKLHNPPDFCNKKID